MQMAICMLFRLAKLFFRRLVLWQIKDYSCIIQNKVFKHIDGVTMGSYIRPTLNWQIFSYVV